MNAILQSDSRWSTIKRLLAIGVFLAFATVHSIFPSRLGLDWPTVALLLSGFCLFLVPRPEILLPFVKSLKIGKAEIELRQQTEALAVSVAKSEESAEPTLVVLAENAPALPNDPPLDDPYKRLVNTNVEAHILNLAGRDKQAALMRLGIEIEKEVLILYGALGLRNQPRSARTFSELVDQLTRHGAMGADIRDGLLEFWKVRNQIAHSRLSDDSILTSTINSGLRLLRLLKAVPRQSYRVLHPRVGLYADENCREPIPNYQAVILEVLDHQGKKTIGIYPAGRDFVADEFVGWDWDMSRVYRAAYYRNPDSGEIAKAWDSAAAFIGQSQPISHS